jgi:pyridoxamine 5'-phosphate oxidase
MNDDGKMSLEEVRRHFGVGKLHESDLVADPLKQFASWYADAEKACRFYPNHMTLSSVDDRGAPQSRIVLLKGVDAEGFVFFTNYQSRKGQQLENNSAASITFFWEELERQVNISGSVSQVSAEESDEYFASRERGSQIGAWVSRQSSEIDDRSVLEEEKLRLTEVYEGKQVPRPAHWGGYRLFPERIEFWQGQPDRLHDRLEYQLDKGEWIIHRLSP